MKKKIYKNPMWHKIKEEIIRRYEQEDINEEDKNIENINEEDINEDKNLEIQKDKNEENINEENINEEDITGKDSHEDKNKTNIHEENINEEYINEEKNKTNIQEEDKNEENIHEENIHEENIHEEYKDEEYKDKKYNTKIPTYILDFLGRSEEINCTEESCLVKWYNTNYEMAEEDSLEDIDFTSMENSREIQIPNIIKPHKTFNPIILSNLGISEIENELDLLLEKSTVSEITFYTFSKKYLEFIRCINLSKDKKSVNIFNIDIFEKIFSGKYLDKVISQFINKLVCDPLNYNGTDRQNIIIIILYVYLYTVDLKLPQKNAIYDKLKNNIFLIKPDTKFNISYTKDYNIDKYLLNIKAFVDFYDESNFLNYYYQNYISKMNVERELFTNFISRLNKNIVNIDKSLILDFIRRVFLLHTVLFNVIEDIQIYNTVVNFFNKKIIKFDTEHFKKSILTLYWNMAYKIGQKEVFNLFIIHIIKNSDTFKKLDNLIFKFHLSEIRAWSQFIFLIEENIESFNNLNIAMDLLYYVSENIQKDDIKLTMEIIDLYLKIHDILKLDHLTKFIKLFYKNLRNLFINVLASISVHSEVLEFYNLQSDRISKIILSLQRVVILSIDESKKDKKKESKGQSGIEAMFHSFVSVIYKIEEQLVVIYGDTVKTTKKRSFKISDGKEN